jgi:lycopene cyclase domain-containing protein
MFRDALGADEIFFRNTKKQDGMKFTYLLIDFFTIIIPFLFSFHPKLNFYKRWISFFSAALISTMVFIPWDIYFTHLKVWGFNPAYLSGLYIGNLPLEEVLFFFCIPYSCVFSYHFIAGLIEKGLPTKTVNLITFILVGLSIGMAILFGIHSYTAYTFTLLAVLLAAVQFLFRVKWLAKFYLVYAILLIPFLIVNGLLTGTGLQQPIVWYNNAETIGIRILTIPVEDIFYGMDLILLNVLLFTFFNRVFYAYLKSSRIKKHAQYGTLTHKF